MTAPHHTPDLFALSEINGPVLRPGDPAYADEVTGFNLAALRTPDVVVGATGPDDVVTAMRCPWPRPSNRRPATSTPPWPPTAPAAPNIHGTPGDEQDRARAWTPEVYARLRHDKATYDPANLLRYGHAVTPA